MIRLILILLLSTNVFAENICKDRKLDPNFPEELIIHENDITASSALEGAKFLSKITTKPDVRKDGSELYISTANSEIIVTAYILKSQCLISQKEEDCKDFCKYFTQKALWYD